MGPTLFDAHNHLQDARLKRVANSVWPALQEVNLARMVVNGTSEEDWPEVLALAQQHPQVLPSFGYHPWYVRERTPEWQASLVHILDLIPSAIGEIGLDRWIKDHDVASQEETFLWQLRLAATRNLPVSIHCLQAWGRMLECLQNNPLPRCGFLLHSYGGPKEMIEPLACLGAYFSLPGHFAHERKHRQCETFVHVPPERLLIETDAPDQSLPDDRAEFSLEPSDQGKPVNHPANIRAVYNFAAELLGVPFMDLATQIEHNFRSLFGALAPQRHS